MSEAPQLSAYPRPAQASIVAAARVCFRRLGVEKTRMEHVAAEAQLSRQTLYRYVSGRDELVELALMERLREFSQELRPPGPIDPTRLVEAITEMLIASIAMGREDAEFRDLSEAIPQSRLGTLTTSQASPVHELVLYSFAPLLTAGRVAQVLREEPSDHEIVEWLTGVMLLFASRLDLDEHAQRRRIRLFIIPALIR
jgi:AcrR family transcriptional regulator